MAQREAFYKLKLLNSVVGGENQMGRSIIDRSLLDAQEIALTWKKISDYGAEHKAGSCLERHF
ncbi:hypothetical protein NBRC116587_24340 [Pseudoteredinibacter isoporae]